MRTVRRFSAHLGVVVLALGGCAGDAGDDPEGGPPPADGADAAEMAGEGGDAPGRGGADWSEVVVDGGPPATTDALLVVGSDGTVWLHGGRVAGEPVTDLWRFDGETWDRVAVEGEVPDARFDHVGVWDDVDDRLVVATGQATATELFDDVWAFDPRTGEWEQLATGGPRPRYGSCAVLDGDRRMIMSHGFSLEQRFADTWAFDLGDGSWSEITPADGPRPAARCLHACGWDPEAEELVLFGGRTNETAYVGDTWRLGGDGWREIGGEGPVARVHAGGVTVGGEFLVVGGQGDGGLPGDAWQLDGDAWSTVDEGTPAARHSHAMAERDGVAWMFGGASDDGDLADLWRRG